MRKMWFATFAEANEWGRAQSCGTVLRSSDSIGFDWILSKEDEPSYLPIQVERLSSFVSYSFNGMTIKCRNLFLQELRKWRPVAEGAQRIIVESDRILAWTDLETGLSWDAALVFRDPHGTLPYDTHKILNELNYGGFSDWRQPTIYELSTLLTELETGNGLYIKRPLLGERPHQCWGASRLTSDDSAYFDFNLRRPDTQRYVEDDNGGRGRYTAQYVASRSVRGQLTVSQKSWVNTVARWAAKNNNLGIPQNEGDIIALQELILEPDILGNIDDLPNEFLNLKHVRSIKVGGKLGAVPDLVFQFHRLKELDICGYECTEISERIANLKDLEVLKFRDPLKRLPDKIIELEALKLFLLPHYSTFQLTPDQVAWVQRLQERGCVVRPLPR